MISRKITPPCASDASSGPGDRTDLRTLTPSRSTRRTGRAPSQTVLRLGVDGIVSSSAMGTRGRSGVLGSLRSSCPLVPIVRVDLNRRAPSRELSRVEGTRAPRGSPTIREEALAFTRLSAVRGGSVSLSLAGGPGLKPAIAGCVTMPSRTWPSYRSAFCWSEDPPLGRSSTIRIVSAPDRSAARCEVFYASSIS